MIGGDNPAKGYMVLVAIGAILMCITSWIAFAKCKERHTVDMTHEEHVFKSAGKLLKVKENVSDDRILVCRMYPVSDYHVIFCFLLHVLSDESWPDRYLHVSDLHQWYGRCYGADADSP